MSDRPSAWRPDRIIRIAKPTAVCSLGWIGLYTALLLIQSGNQNPLPDARIHMLLLFVPGIFAIVGVMLLVYAKGRLGQGALGLGQAGLERLIREADRNHVRALSSLADTFILELANRSDLSTDRLVGLEDAHRVLSARLDARLAVLETAVRDHVCDGYAEGVADGLARTPIEDGRRHLKSINGRAVR